LLSISPDYICKALSARCHPFAVTDWKQISRYGSPGLTERTLSKIDDEKMEEARQVYLKEFNQDSFIAYGHVIKI
jgi:hypothetical protein